MAYEVLSNPEKRLLYNQAGEQGIKDGGYGQQHNSMDIFNLFFGGCLWRGMGSARSAEASVGQLEQSSNVTTARVAAFRQK